MSNAVFPASGPGLTLPGLSFDISKSPRFNTIIQKAASGLEYRVALQQYPLWDFILSYELLRSDSYAELQTLMAFYVARQGAFDSFLFADPDDSKATAQVCYNPSNSNVGDGTNTTFQMMRSYGGFVEPVQNPNVITSVMLNGTPTSAYTQTSGLITFTTAPGVGVLVTWTGTFYYRTRFLADTIEFSKFYNNMWELKKIEFTGSPRNMV